MAVYLTKSSLLKLKLIYPLVKDECTAGEEQWQKVYENRKNGIRLAADMICRVCARNGCTPITDKVDTTYTIMSAIQSITNVTVDMDDALPKFICTMCLETLKIAVTFKKNCEAADRRFKKILNPMGDPSLHSYPYSKHDFQLILHKMKEKRLKIEQQKANERKQLEKMLQKKKQQNKAKEFNCSPCGLVFPSKEKLVAHRRERQCMRRACELCGQLVLSISQHMRHIHKQRVLHKCPTCGKEFPIHARLKSHMVVHTNTFNFFCDLCPYKCKHKYYLVMHMRTHTGEKPYKCPECPATFVNPSNLNKHKLVHQAKQFKCAQCEKEFRTTSALREHHEATHMNIKHTCAYCGRDFCYKSDLRKHEIRTHNRTKRDYVGGEPTYKQVERMQKMQESEMEKWRQEQLAQQQQPTLVQVPYLEPIYFTDVTTILQTPQGQTIVPQQTVQLSLPELSIKKDDVKQYETQQVIGYF